MRGSFGGGGGRGMGGGWPGGMLRTVHRAVRAGGVGGGTTQEQPWSHATYNNSNSFRASKNFTATTASNNNATSLSSSISSSTSSPSTSHSVPIYAASPTAPPLYGGFFGDESDWEHIDGSEDEGGLQSTHFDDFVFGGVPSREEVQHAVGALQLAFEPAASFPFIKDRLSLESDSEVEEPVWGTADLDWIEPSEQLYNPIMSRPYRVDRVYDAFHLLQTEPSVQRMVLSLSSDRAIWNAVMNNEAVQEFRESLDQDAVNRSSRQSSGEDSDGSNAAKDLMSRIVDTIKARLNQLIEKIMMVVNDVFQSQEKTVEGTISPLEEKLRASFLLSVVVLVIVAVTRAHEA